ncbi:hypothetical protein WJX82_001297 [Trebouxia sp. C0006]
MWVQVVSSANSQTWKVLQIRPLYEPADALSSTKVKSQLTIPSSGSSHGELAPHGPSWDSSSAVAAICTTEGPYYARCQNCHCSTQ